LLLLLLLLLLTSTISVQNLQRVEWDASSHPHDTSAIVPGTNDTSHVSAMPIVVHIWV
jgi:hypothetical protein